MLVPAGAVFIRAVQVYTATGSTFTGANSYLEKRDITFLEEYISATTSTGTPKYYAMLDTGATRVYKSRVNNITNALAWRHRSAPSLMYLPVGIFAGMDKIGGKSASAIVAAAKIGDSEGTEYLSLIHI